MTIPISHSLTISDNPEQDYGVRKTDYEKERRADSSSDNTADVAYSIDPVVDVGANRNSYVLIF